MSAGTNDPERMTLTANGLRFDALSAGPPDGVLILLLHGFPQFADAWKRVMPQLAATGHHVVAVDQRGYSAGARPRSIKQYAVNHLVSDVLGFADALHAQWFHLVGHDWGGILAWNLAASFPDRLRTLTSLSTPHPDALFEAIDKDPDQAKRSRYLALFRAPLHAAETALLALDAKLLRSVYLGKLPDSEVAANVRRLSEDGTLTAALNWYRALEFGRRTGSISVPALYIWGDQDQALGETAALATAGYVAGPYHFERLEGRSHWLLEDASDQLVTLLLEHVKNSAA